MRLLFQGKRKGRYATQDYPHSVAAERLLFRRHPRCAREGFSQEPGLQDRIGRYVRRGMR